MTKRNDISVPQGYFQNLEQRLSRIPQQEVRPTTFQKVSPWLAYAASLVVLASVGGFIFRKAAQPVQEEYSWDYLSYLSQSLDPDGWVELEESPELSDEDIINYLLADNNISLELLAEANYEENN
ncbi:MAG: hypothetical protein IJQ96_07520 [Bacteroidales bacterium]|nr:hypothetical protein [Bacteroidales bacterium]